MLNTHENQTAQTWQKGAGGCHVRLKKEGPETHRIKSHIHCEIPDISSEAEDNTSGLFVAIKVRMLV